jgi:uncharacterized protein involved in exopolysaccharide biosynthesis
MTIFDLLGVLYSRRRLLFGILFAIVGAGMVVTFLTPPAYQSTMKILVTRDRLDPQVTPAEKNSDVLRGEITEDEFNSELEILQSNAVIEAVARQLGIDKQYEEASRGRFARARARLANVYRSFHGQTAPEAMERAVSDISEHLEAVPVKKSRVIKVTYKDSDPERAARTLDELYRQYAEHHLRLRQNSKAANVFHQQSEAFDRKLQEATEELKRFDERNGVSANTAQRELVLRQFYETQDQLDRTRTEIRETEQRIAALKTQLASQPERIESESRTKYVSARDKIKDEILTLELQRTQLLQKYQPGSRLVKDVEERLARTRELLAREEQSPPREQTTVLNEVHRRLTGELLAAQANLTTLAERERSLASLDRQYKARVSRFDARTLERAELERARAVNEEAYLLYRKKAQEADIVNALNQERIVNFSLAEPPSVSRRPVSPKPLLNFAALLVVGLIASVATVAMVERSRLLPGAPNLPSRAESLPMDGGNSVLSLQRATIMLSGDQQQRNDRLLPAAPEHLREDSLAPDSGEATDARKERITKPLPPEPGSSRAPRQTLPFRNDPDGGRPEAWRVEAFVDYLHVVCDLPSGKLSQVLRETAGWEISQAEIDEMLSRARTRQNEKIVSPPPSQMAEFKALIDSWR